MAGTAFTALVIVALAAGAAERTAAIVELQVVPRGPGVVSGSPAAVDLDNGNAAVTAPCDENDGDDSCRWGYEQGSTVTLTATAEQGKSFVGWSTPDCPGTGTCTVTLDGDVTSVVALFSPLRLAVRYSSESGTVTVDRPANPCSQNGADACFEVAAHSEVRLTATPAAGHTFTGWNPGCEPTNAPTCTIRVNDQPTWAGVIFDGDPAPQLPTRVKVQFRLTKTGNGAGQVTASEIDCGGQCTAKYDYGQTLSLTAKADPGSRFDGWNGVCSKTQTTCEFPVGPITSIKAQFIRGAALSAPRGLTVTSRTRARIAVAWSTPESSTGVVGYRVYLNGTAAGNTKVRRYALKNLACGREYRIAVDAVDSGGNRSPRATLAAATKPCALAARTQRIDVVYAGRIRTIVLTLRVNRATTARLRLLRRGRLVVAAARGVRPGTNALRIRVPTGAPPGVYRLSIALVDPDGGTLALSGRNVLLRRR